MDSNKNCKPQSRCYGRISVWTKGRNINRWWADGCMSNSRPPTISIRYTKGLSSEKGNNSLKWNIKKGPGLIFPFYLEKFVTVKDIFRSDDTLSVYPSNTPFLCQSSPPTSNGKSSPRRFKRVWLTDLPLFPRKHGSESREERVLSVRLIVQWQKRIKRSVD